MSPCSAAAERTLRSHVYPPESSSARPRSVQDPLCVRTAAWEGPARGLDGPARSSVPVRPPETECFARSRTSPSPRVPSGRRALCLGATAVPSRLLPLNQPLCGTSPGPVGSGQSRGVRVAGRAADLLCHLAGRLPSLSLSFLISGSENDGALQSGSTPPNRLPVSKVL